MSHLNDLEPIEAPAPVRRRKRPPLLEIAGLRTHFFTAAGVVRAVDGVSYTVRAGETLGVVGETGCGKSVTALSVLRLVADRRAHRRRRDPLGRRQSVELSESEMEDIRGNAISMIFQEPMTSLNPLMTIGRQISERSRCPGVARREAMDRRSRRCAAAHSRAGAPRARLPAPAVGRHPAAAMIAMALSCNPKLLIADEPTTALDVTIQAQILDLMRELQETLGTAIILITHDMGVVAENADRVVVMYAGRKVEEAASDDLFERPGHPYTVGLLGSLPNLEKAARTDTRRARLNEIKGWFPRWRGCRKDAASRRAAVRNRSVPRRLPPLEEHRPGHWGRAGTPAACSPRHAGSAA